jgi:hypothetical protein
LPKDFDAVVTVPYKHCCVGSSSGWNELPPHNQDARSFTLYVLLLLLLPGLGLFPAFVAHQKGYSFAQWWLYGTLVFIVALPHALLRRSKGSLLGNGRLPGDKTCPYCQESVPLEDDVCPACHLRVYDPALHGPPIEDCVAQRHVLRKIVIEPRGERNSIRSL